MSLFIGETFLNATENYIFGESDVYEVDFDNAGEAFRSLRAEYGRCISRVYNDGVEGTRAVGWVFEKRDRYEDTGESYLRHVWVTLHRAPPTKSIEYHYHELAAA